MFGKVRRICDASFAQTNTMLLLSLSLVDSPELLCLRDSREVAREIVREREVINKYQ